MAHWKFQNRWKKLRRVSNQRPLAYQRVALTTRLSGQLTTYCLNFSTTFYATINQQRHAGKHEVAGSIPGWGTYFQF